jgi:hypothetical protein
MLIFVTVAIDISSTSSVRQSVLHINFILQNQMRPKMNDQYVRCGLHRASLVDVHVVRVCRGGTNHKANIKRKPLKLSSDPWQELAVTSRRYYTPSIDSRATKHPPASSRILMSKWVRTHVSACDNPYLHPVTDRKMHSADICHSRATAFKHLNHFFSDSDADGSWDTSIVIKGRNFVHKNTIIE